MCTLWRMECTDVAPALEWSGPADRVISMVAELKLTDKHNGDVLAMRDWSGDVELKFTQCHLILHSQMYF